MRSIIIALTLTWFLGSISAFGLQRFDIVTTEELEQMLAQRQTGTTEFALVNTLDEIIYRNVSIPDSINVPWSRVTETADRLGNDKDKLIVTY